MTLSDIYPTDTHTETYRVPLLMLAKIMLLQLTYALGPVISLAGGFKGKRKMLTIMIRVVMIALATQFINRDAVATIVEDESWPLFIAAILSYSGALHTFYTFLAWQLPLADHLPLAALQIAALLQNNPAASICASASTTPHITTIMTQNGTQIVHAEDSKFKDIANIFNWPYAIVEPEGYVQLQQSMTPAIACMAVTNWTIIAVGFLLPTYILLVEAVKNISRQRKRTGMTPPTSPRKFGYTNTKMHSDSGGFTFMESVELALIEKTRVVCFLLMQAVWCFVILRTARTMGQGGKYNSSSTDLSSASTERLSGSIGGVWRASRVF